jgi:hypothetical protein
MTAEAGSYFNNSSGIFWSNNTLTGNIRADIPGDFQHKLCAFLRGHEQRGIVFYMLPATKLK